jgi:hypothetical protein
MKTPASHSPLRFLILAAATQVARRPYVSTSAAVHAVLLALIYYYGSYQVELHEQAAEVASSLRATSEASTAKRLQDLQTIKQLLEKSAGRVDSAPVPGPTALPEPQTPEEMVEQARQLSESIDAVDEEIKKEELAELTRALDPRHTEAPAQEHQTDGSKPDEPGKPDAASTDARKPGINAPAAITQEMAEREVAELEAKARSKLVERQQHLDAKANGVPIGPQQAGSGEQASSGNPSASPVKEQGSDTSGRAEIADFIGAGARTQEMRRSEKYTSLDFFRGGPFSIPPVDFASMVRGRGRMLGAGGEYANRVYLNTWYIIGPFPGRHGNDLFDNPSYPPEKAVLLDAVYYGKDQRLLKWRYVTAPSYPLVPPDTVEDSVYYGYTEVFVDQACDLTAWIGVDDDVQIYLNDRMVWEGGNVNKRPYFDSVFNTRNTYLRDYNRTEGKRVLHFNKGRNRIFFKLSNGPNDPYLSMVLTR